MPTKAYFIGLGGCGMHTVANLQNRLCPTGDFSEYKFTYVDTDDSTLKEVNKNKTIVRTCDLINVGDTNPYQVYMNALGSPLPRARRFMEWVIKQGQKEAKEARFTLPNNFLSDGARGQRMIGRTAVYHRYDSIFSEFRSKLATFAKYDPHASENQIPQIWVVASSCGGTGSSMTLDVLYMLDKIVNDSWKSAPELRLVLFMPQPFIEANQGNPDYSMNAYSYFWELNAFRLDHQIGVLDRFCNFSVEPTESSGRTFPLYKYIIPVDVETSSGTKIPLNDLYPTVAELIYYCNKGSAANEMMSRISNDQNNLNNLSQHTSSRFRWTQTLVPYGYRLIKKANEEFREYLQKRARYEVLHYGLLGEGMPDDPAVREKAKKEFSKTYVLKYICDCPSADLTAGEQSLQADVEELYSAIPVSQTNLDKQRINYYLTQIDEQEIESRNLAAAAYDRVVDSIDLGVQAAIINHGLRYTKELLSLVDDFYLQEEVLQQLKAEYEDARVSKEEQRSKCERLLATYKDKQAAEMSKALNEYKEISKKYVTLDLAIDMIENKLTPYPGGYLEKLRRGDDRINGLQPIISRIEAAASAAFDSYEALAKKFMETEKDALTQYLPTLSSIAKGKNDSIWPKDTFFDRMYRDSMIDIDIEYERANKVRIPARTNSGDNNLCAYVGRVCAGETSVLKLAKHNDTFRLDRNLKEWILEPLELAVSEAVNREGSQADKWIKLSLEESLDMELMLPEGVSREKFINSMSDRSKIPVLFPTVPGTQEPPLVRIMFAGASESFARTLGYVPEDNAGNKFIQDNEMTDRFLIIKMPLGYDFMSYKYFLPIQKEYQKNLYNIRKEMHGCHTHKEFATLDLEIAMRNTRLRTQISYVTDLFKAVFCQEFLNVLEKEQKDVYDRLWGSFALPDFSVPLAQSDPFGSTSSDPFGMASDPSGAVADPFGMASDPFASAADPFGGGDPFAAPSHKFLLKADYNNAFRTLTIDARQLIRRDFVIECTDEEISIEAKELTTFTNFLNELIDKDTYGVFHKALCSAAELKSLMTSDKILKDAYSKLFTKVQAAVMQNQLFVMALNWRKQQVQTESIFFEILSQIYKGNI